MLFLCRATLCDAFAFFLARVGGNFYRPRPLLSSSLSLSLSLSLLLSTKKKTNKKVLFFSTRTLSRKTHTLDQNRHRKIQSRPKRERERERFPEFTIRFYSLPPRDLTLNNNNIDITIMFATGSPSSTSSTGGGGSGGSGRNALVVTAMMIAVMLWMLLSSSSTSSSALSLGGGGGDGDVAFSGGEGYVPAIGAESEELKVPIVRRGRREGHPSREKDTFDAHHHAQFKSINEEAKKCSLIVASFYATKPGGFERKKGERCNGCHEPPVFITMESARMTNGPGTCVALITDDETEIDMSKPGMDKVQLHRFEGILDRSKIGTGALMLERMKLYNAFIKRARDNDWNADLLMVDTDIVFVGDVTDLFQTRNFDYGVTIRDNKAYPVQGGVQFVPKGKYVGAAKFSDHTLDLWKSDLEKSGKEAGFTGDQAAYQRGLNVPAAKVQSLARGKKVIDLPVVCGSSGAEVVTVRMIPGDQYNFVPSGNGQGLKKKDIRILHYKGGKKEGMYVPYKAMQKNVKDVFKLKKLVV